MVLYFRPFPRVFFLRVKFWAGLTAIFKNSTSDNATAYLDLYDTIYKKQKIVPPSEPKKSSAQYLVKMIQMAVVWVYNGVRLRNTCCVCLALVKIMRIATDLYWCNHPLVPFRPAETSCFSSKTKSNS